MNAVSFAARLFTRDVVSNSMKRNDSLARCARRHARGPSDRTARLGGTDGVFALAPRAGSDQGARPIARDGGDAVSGRPFQSHLSAALRRRGARDAAATARSRAAK